jgi:hypothetical protein
VYTRCRIITITARIEILEEPWQGWEHSLVPRDSQDRRQDHRIMHSRGNRLDAASSKAHAQSTDKVGEHVQSMDNSKAHVQLTGSRYSKGKDQLTGSRYSKGKDQLTDSSRNSIM